MFKLKYTIDDEGAKKMLEEFPERMHGAVNRGIAAASAFFEGLVVEKIRQPHGQKPAAVAFGNLVNAVATMHGGAGDRLYAMVTVAPPADLYAAPVETGTRPHWPPMEPIMRWVRKKLLDTMTARFAGSKGGEQEIKSRAFLIARKIARRGTEGHFMFQRAFNEGHEQAETLIDDQIAREIAAINNEGMAG